MRLKDELLVNYPDVDERVGKFLERIISQLSLNKSNVSDYARALLEMLAFELMLYYKAADSMIKDEVLHVDDYKRASKSPAIPVMQSANDKILVLLDKLGISPMAKAKIARLNNTAAVDSAKELLEELVS